MPSNELPKDSQFALLAVKDGVGHAAISLRMSKPIEERLAKAKRELEDRGLIEKTPIESTGVLIAERGLLPEPVFHPVYRVTAKGQEMIDRLESELGYTGK